MTRDDLVKLDRILGMLGSAHDGERAAAALAATRFIDARNTSWWQLLAGGQPATTPGKRRTIVRGHDLGVDHNEAASSRLRQMRAHIAALEIENKRLKARLGNMAEQHRRHHAQQDDA